MGCGLTQHEIIDRLKNDPIHFPFDDIFRFEGYLKNRKGHLDRVSEDMYMDLFYQVVMAIDFLLRTEPNHYYAKRWLEIVNRIEKALEMEKLYPY